MLQDKETTLAVSKIRQRAERQTDLRRLIESYVDSGIVPQLINENHQIVFGRRGTGKTHVFQVLRSVFEKNRFCVAYIDCRTLGSSSQFTDRDLPIGRRCLALFRDFLSPLYNELIEHIIEFQTGNPETALEYADEFLKASTQPTTIFETKEIELTKTHESEDRASVKAEAKAFEMSLGIGAEGSAIQKTGTGKSQKVAVTTEDKVIFPAIYYFLKKTLEASNIRLLILVDEWSSVPRDIQPFFAEFIKRGILPVTHATVKIAALEQRSDFSKRIDDYIIGLEVGADISMTQDLDDNYVYDRNPKMIAVLYADIIYKHLQLELPEGYLSEQFKINDGKDLRSKIFTGLKSFNELSRAS